MDIKAKVGDKVVNDVGFKGVITHTYKDYVIIKWMDNECTKVYKNDLPIEFCLVGDYAFHNYYLDTVKEWHSEAEIELKELTEQLETLTKIMKERGVYNAD